MVEKIKATKDKVLDFMEREIGKYNGDRMDVKEAGDLADIIKDLAEAEKSCWEAEYYRSVSEAMGSSSGSSGYTQPTGDRMGYGDMGGGARRGYSGGMGHTDPLSSIREMMSSLSPEMRKQLRNELM